MIIESIVSGMVLRILVAPGDEITVDQEVMIIEAMKMEIPIAAKTAGTVVAILVAQGDLIRKGDDLVSLKSG